MSGWIDLDYDSWEALERESRGCVEYSQIFFLLLLLFVVVAFRCTAKPETVKLSITKCCSSVLYSQISTRSCFKCLSSLHLSLKTMFWRRHHFWKGSPTQVLDIHYTIFCRCQKWDLPPKMTSGIVHPLEHQPKIFVGISVSWRQKLYLPLKLTSGMGHPLEY